MIREKREERRKEGRKKEEGREGGKKGDKGKSEVGVWKSLAAEIQMELKT